ncbi:MAG: (Fe-S)-binding protein [Peptococcaceae bacterium]|nr:(Fe-S)-binding protein [Peptococcaceae bacterium]
MGMSLYTKRAEFNDENLDILYRCTMCGACDVSCKCTKDMEVMEINQELRLLAVAEGQINLAHSPLLDSLRQEDNMMQKKKQDRGNWADGLTVKNITQEKAQVYFHAGCRYSFDQELWPEVRSALTLLQKAGVDVAIAGKDENCCAGRAYEIGYQSELNKYGENNLDLLKNAGIKTIVTPCAECYYAFKVLYPKLLKTAGLEVLHITEYLNRLIKEGALKPSKKVEMRVTYHDPCHLGRLGEPYIPWEGEEIIVNQGTYIYDPPKPWRKGTYGVYEPPRDLLQSIPGIELVEMERIKEYAWCCGAGAAVIDTYPELAEYGAEERLEEAGATGAEAIVTACPYCKTNFNQVIQANHHKLKVYDILELLEQSI